MSSVEPPGKLPRTFWFLVSGTFINRLGSFLLLFLPFYLTKKHGFSKEYAGFVVSLYGAGSILSGPLGGYLADHIGRRKSMILAMLVGSAAMLQLGIAQQSWYILLSAFVLGALGDLYRPAVNATIADVVPPADRARAYGWNYWAANLGFSGASLIGGVLARYGFNWLFIADAGTTLIFGLLVLFFVPETKPQGQVLQPFSTELPEKKLERAVSFFPYWDLVFLGFIGTQFLLELVLQQANVSLSLDIGDHGVAIETFGMMMGINAIMIVFLQPWMRAHTHSFKRSYVLSLSALLLGIGYFMNTLPGGIPMYIFSIIVWTFGEILMFSMIPPIISDLAPQHLRGTYQGGYQLTVAVAAFVAPTFGTMMLSRFGSKVLWLSCLLMGLLAAVLHLLLGKARKRRLAGMYGIVEAIHREDGVQQEELRVNG